MQTIVSYRRSRWLVLSLVGLLAGCVEARDTPTQGDTNFVSGLPSSSLDYQSAGSTPTGGAGGTGMLPTAGMSADPLNPMSSTAGAGGTAGTGTPMGGAGGHGGTAGLSGAGGVGGTGDGGQGGTAGAGTAAAGGMSGEGGEAGAGPATAGTLTIDFTSVGNDGEYGPRNIGAVWIETASGQFVKTTERWAGIRAGDLFAWNAASGGWGGGFFFATGSSPDQVDAVSAATLRTHQAHHSTWNMKDAAGMVVADGSYRIMIEVTESERQASGTASIEFDKGAAPVTLSPSDDGPYSGLTVTYTP